MRLRMRTASEGTFRAAYEVALIFQVGFLGAKDAKHAEGSHHTTIGSGMNLLFHYTFFTSGNSKPSPMRSHSARRN